MKEKNNKYERVGAVREEDRVISIRGHRVPRFIIGKKKRVMRE